MLHRCHNAGCRQPGFQISVVVVCSLFTILLTSLPLVQRPAGAARTADRIVAIVNDEVITLSEMNANIRGEEARLRQQYKGRELDHQLKQLQYRALSRLIERRLQIQVAQEMGLEVSDEELRAAVNEMQRRGEPVDASDPEFLKMLREQLTVWKVMEREVRSGVLVSEEDVKRYYDENMDHFMLPAEYHISQILIRAHDGESPLQTRARAMKVHEALMNGGEFAELASRWSDGAEATFGGSLGLVREGELEPSLEKAIATAKPGDISEPIQTDDGFHILRLDDRKPPEFRQYAQVKPEIQNLVYQQKSDDQYNKWMDELKDKAYIEVKL